MTDERFDELMRDAAQTYRVPPPPPLDAMWSAIEESLDDEAAGGAPARVDVRRGWQASGWLRAAALLALGIAIGRGTAFVGSGPEPVASEFAGAAAEPADGGAVTEQYLDRAAALLTALPVELRQANADSTFTAHVADLLLQTRRMLDSPEIGDPGLHALLEDLELVLVQVVRLHADRDPVMVDLLEESLEQRDVLPRVRSAVAYHSTDEE